MSRINWTQVGVFAVIVLIIFFVGMTVSPFLLGGFGWGMMGPGMMGRDWSPGWCPFCGGAGRFPGGFYGGIFGWLFMLPLMQVPLYLLALVGLGIFLAVRGVSRASPGAKTSSLTCPTCGKAVEVDWRVCPFCEEDLEKLG